MLNAIFMREMTHYLKFALLGMTLAWQGCTSPHNSSGGTRPATSGQPEVTTGSGTSKPDKRQWPRPDNVEAYFTAYGKENPETLVKLGTRLGDIVIRLYEDTPLHRANFIHHIKNSLYDNTIFYRVVPDFMIQGGNSDDDQTLERRKNIPAYYIPSEVRGNHIHQRGAVAMAMSYVNNPEMKSAQYSFYIVIGHKFSPAELKAVENEYDMNIPESSRKVYMEVGGAPHLDGKHTVFGEVVEGMDVVEAISREERDSGDWPVNDVVIDYTILE